MQHLVRARPSLPSGLALPAPGLVLGSPELVRCVAEWPAWVWAPALASRAPARCAAVESDSVSERPALVRCAAVETGSVLERPEPVRCAAESESELVQALGPALLRPRAAAATAPFSPAPIPFRAPAVPPVASEPQAALLPAVVEAALGAKASVPQAVGHAGAPRPVAAAVTAAQREAEPQEAELLEAPVAPVAPPWVLPSALAWAFRRDRLPPWPAPRPVARSVRAMGPPRTAGL